MRITGALTTDHCIIPRVEKRDFGRAEKIKSGFPTGSKKGYRSSSRKPFEPASLGHKAKAVWWPEHPLAKTPSYNKGFVPLSRLGAWQNRGYNPLVLSILNKGDFRGGRFLFEPGAYDSTDRLWWPEHPLALKSGAVTCQKIIWWQDHDYDPIFIDPLRECKTRFLESITGGPHSILIDSKGYEKICWPDHPLSTYQGRYINVHQLVVWQQSGYSKEILELFLSRKILVHHRNTKRSDNDDPENLEIRLRGNHPYGAGEKDMVIVLKSLGYTVTPP